MEGGHHLSPAFPGRALHRSIAVRRQKFRELIQVSLFLKKPLDTSDH
jgi:hypothetical protein